MEFFTSNILTIVTFTPAAGALLFLFYDREHARSIRISALIFTLLAFFFSLYLVARFDSSNPDFQFGLKVPWIRSLGIDYSMGVDGISLVLRPAIELWLFIAFFLAFAIKVPLFPFHTWLPDAHVEAPTAGSVLLAGVLLKMGTYGLVRFSLPLFPHISHLFAPLISLLAIVGLIYGALLL